jgi:16S rRNA (uracil1498-N3)-methyltransferase
MRTTRIFIAEPIVAGARVTLSRQTSEHLTRVLRLAVGAPLVAFDGNGAEFDAELSALAKAGAEVRVGAARHVEPEPKLTITLLQSLARGEKMDWIVQKATELGVSRIVPVISERSVVKLDVHQAAKRREHWSGVAIAACEQCGRNRLPEIAAPVALAPALLMASALHQRLVFDAGADLSLTASLTVATSSIALLVGPEGGLSDLELQAAGRAEFRAVNFGPRILRTETAAIAALAVVQNRIGDM